MEQSWPGGRGYLSVLSCFPPSVGRDVAVAVVKPLGAGLGNPSTHSLLHTDRQVKWAMEVLCYGLTLPSDAETVKLCVDVYSDWLTALVSPSESVPPPISREPNLYVQNILRHLCSLFLPRSDQVSPHYLGLCQQVLSAVQSLAREGAAMTRDTWETLLHFLLRINHAVLTPPTATGVLWEQLSDASMAVLFEVWLLSCWRCFPSRSMWQTFRHMMTGWRRHLVAVEQWSRVVSALTSRLLLLTFGPSFPRLNVPDEDSALIPADLEDQRVSHTWFRFLHLLSNPADISHQVVVGSTPSPPDEVLRGDGSLPSIFFRAMRGVSALVDAFLGVTVINQDPSEQQPPHAGQTSRIHFRDRLPSLSVAVTRSPFKDRLPPYGLSRPRSGSAPPTPVNILSRANTSSYGTSPPKYNGQLKPVAKATSKPMVSSSPHQWKSSPHPTSTSPLLCSSPRPPPSPIRSSVDSLLHLFGSWLFDAALIHKQSGLPDRWAAGRAEACGTLCRIFTCKKTAEEILSVYLSRFYVTLLQGLQVSPEACPPVLASILLNSTCLFCCDLRGVVMLLPPFLSALENVLLDRELLRFKCYANLVDLRRSSILILLSLLPLPLQFPLVQSEVLLNGEFSGDDVTAGSILSLKPRLISVLIGVLNLETDSSNIQLILAAILNLVQDSAAFEAAGQTQQEAAPQLDGAQRPCRTGGTTAKTRAPGRTIQSDTTASLWVKVVQLLTQRLTIQWKNNSVVCLSALEVLGGLAKVKVKVEAAERRRAIASVCSCIVFQCGRPPPLHSRELHSVIVASFCCLNVWLTQHPVVLDEQDCLSGVLEIVELGLSGSKSRQEEDVRSKEEKELNPTSLRVKEAAEETLSCVMQASGVFPFLGNLLDEAALIDLCGLNNSSEKKFRYFVLDKSVIVAMLEQSAQPGDSSRPSLTALIRGPTGCHAWTLELRLQPREGSTPTQEPEFAQRRQEVVVRATVGSNRDNSGQQQTLVPECSEGAQEDSGKRCGIRAQSFPVKADLSIPPLHEIVTETVQRQLEFLKAAFKRQQQVEAQPGLGGLSGVMKSCRMPPPVAKFQTARLFLSHLGLLTPETLKNPGIGSAPAQLVSLDSSVPGFSEDLMRLDLLPSRRRDSAFVFCMRAGQRTAAEIVRNVTSSHGVPPHFLNFLSSLGQPVAAGQRLGQFSAVLGDSGGGVFNGDKCVLVDADALTEIAFIVPSSPHMSDWPKSQVEAETHSESPGGEDVKSSRFVSSFIRSDSKLLIVWIERFQDIESFPLTELLSETKNDTPSVSAQLIFIHPLQSGLYRICLHGNNSSKFSLVVPLVSGSVVSQRSLGFLVRETVINFFHRRQLENDSAPLPHVRRKHMISDIIDRYRSRRPEPTFYSALFQDP
ncbi:ral GTPase-activating protein subunit beta-like isoform X2 [Antennarius striatus]|uniref:ral GTPase-activating protein subunit beta-like isoform X2 n=1 Tax=Antennarius striatus TaxID=241820 RepID=UPI0035B2B6D0